MSTTAFVPEPNHPPTPAAAPALETTPTPVEAAHTTDNRTPGPWRAGLLSDSSFDGIPHLIVEAGCGYADRQYAGFGIDGFIRAADAALIVAAPDLLQALQDLIDGNSALNVSEAITQARAAIAKAITPLNFGAAPVPEPSESGAEIPAAPLVIEQPPQQQEPEPQTPIERALADDNYPF